MKYLETFVDNLVIGLDETTIPREIDIVLEGGALNAAYHIGSLCYLKKLEQENKIKIKRLSGVSCGALISVFYLTIGFENVEAYYNKLSNCLTNTGNFSCLKETIDSFLTSISDEQISKLNNRLFISYVDLNTQKRIVVSEFNTKEELADTLFKSSFIPGLIDGRIKTNDNCIDGGFPYIFPNDINKRNNPNYKTLYLKLTSLEILKDIVSTKGEVNIARRAVEGIQKTHDLFKYKTSNNIASFVEDWSTVEIIKHSTLNISWWVLVFVIHYVVVIYDLIPENIKKHNTTKRITNIIIDLWNDYLSRLIIR